MSAPSALPGRLLVAVAVVALLALPILGAPSAGAAPAATAQREGACPTADGVTVVVDFRELGGGIHVRCARGPVTSGFDALQKAGIDYRTTIRFPGFLCRIADRPANDPCVDASPATAYWSYWLAPRGGQWCYSNWGAGNRRPPPGSVEGWSFALNRTSSTTPPPGIAPPAAIPGAPASLPANDCDPRPGAPAAPPTAAPPPRPAPAPAPPPPAPTTPPAAPAPPVPAGGGSSGGPGGGVSPSGGSGADTNAADGRPDVGQTAEHEPTNGGNPDGATSDESEDAEVLDESVEDGAGDADGDSSGGGSSGGSDRRPDGGSTVTSRAAAEEAAAVDLGGSGGRGTPVATLAAVAVIAAVGAAAWWRRRRGDE